MLFALLKKFAVVHEGVCWVDKIRPSFHSHTLAGDLINWKDSGARTAVMYVDSWEKATKLKCAPLLRKRSEDRGEAGKVM
jgi:hypothetical protein